MKCDHCVQDVSGALYKLEGIKKVEANLADQLVSIEGTGMLSWFWVPGPRLHISASRVAH